MLFTVERCAGGIVGGASFIVRRRFSATFANCAYVFDVDVGVDADGGIKFLLAVDDLDLVSGFDADDWVVVPVIEFRRGRAGAAALTTLLVDDEDDNENVCDNELDIVLIGEAGMVLLPDFVSTFLDDVAGIVYFKVRYVLHFGFCFNNSG